MGGEVMMQFEKGETAKLKTLDWSKLQVGPACEKMGKPDFWVEWKGNVLELGYAFGNPGNAEWAQAIAHEIAKRFNLKKGGWGSVGYCKDVDEFKKARAFSASMFLAENNPISAAFHHLTGLMRSYKRAQKLYESEAKRRLDLQL